MKGLNADVYREARGGDYTNGGVTATHTTFTVFDTKLTGYIEPASVKPGEALLVKRDKEHLRGYLYAVPAIVQNGEVIEAPVPKGHIGWMMGGNFVSTSDSRFCAAVGPLGIIPVHDRSETQAQYDSNWP